VRWRGGGASRTERRRHAPATINCTVSRRGDDMTHLLLINPNTTASMTASIAEAAFHAASMLATGFSVVTTMTRTCVLAERLVQRYGFERACRGVHGTDIAVLALESGDPAMLAQIEDACRDALARDHSGALVLGCAGMATLTRALQRRLGVPVIDGVTVAVKFAEALAALGLRTSKRGDYATPLPKRYDGWAAALGWLVDA
jgi:allantoin racemase